MLSNILLVQVLPACFQNLVVFLPEYIDLFSREEIIVGSPDELFTTATCKLALGVVNVNQSVMNVFYKNRIAYCIDNGIKILP